MAYDTFLKDDTGAVTVDWVVLTGALVGLGLAAMAVVSSGVEDLSNDVDAELQRDDIIFTSFSTPYSPFNQSVYDANFTASGQYVDQDQFDSHYDTSMSFLYQQGHFPNGTEQQLKDAVDVFQGREDGAAVAGYTVTPWTAPNGETYDAAALYDLYEERFPG